LGDAERSQALAVLADAVDGCRSEDMRTPEVFAALEALSARAAVKWPFEQFRESLNFGVGQESRAGGRSQNVNASLNAARRATKCGRT
jgi:hypothetical protein